MLQVRAELRGRAKINSYFTTREFWPPARRERRAYPARGSVKERTTKPAAKRTSRKDGVGRLAVGMRIRPLGSRPVTGRSTQLRIVPSLCPASVLRPSRLPRLDRSLRIGTTGSKVPCSSLFHARAASRPEAMAAACRATPPLIPEFAPYPGFDLVCIWFRPFINGSLSFVFEDLI